MTEPITDYSPHRPAPRAINTHSSLGKLSFTLAVTGWLFVATFGFDLLAQIFRFPTGITGTRWLAALSAHLQQFLPQNENAQVVALIVFPFGLALIGAACAAAIDIRNPAKHVFSNLGFIFNTLLLFFVATEVVMLRMNPAQ